MPATNSGESQIASLLKPTAAKSVTADFGQYLQAQGVDPATFDSLPLAQKQKLYAGFKPPKPTKDQTDTTADFRQYLGAQGIDSAKYLSLPVAQRQALYRGWQQGKTAQAAAMFNAVLPGRIAVQKAGADIHNTEPPIPQQQIENKSRAVTSAKDLLALAGQVYDANTPAIQRILGGLTGTRTQAITRLKPVRDKTGGLLGFTADGRTMFPVP